MNSRSQRALGVSSTRPGHVRVIIVAAVAVAVVLAGVVMMRRAGETSSLEQAETVAVRFLADLQEDQIDAAWEGTSAEFKSFVGRDRLRRMVKAIPALQQPCELLDCRPADVEQLSLLECLFRSSVSGEGTIRVLLASERGEWKVERLYLEEANGS